MNIVILAGLLVATLVSQSYGGAMIPEHPQTAFCNADFVVRVKILGKIKKDEETPTTEAPDEVLGDVITTASTTDTPAPDSSTGKSQLSTVESNTEDPTRLVVMKSSSPQNFQKPSDTPPEDKHNVQDNSQDASSKSNGSLLGSLLGRYKRSLGLRGAPPPGGDLSYRPIGGTRRDKGMMYYDVLIKKVFKVKIEIYFSSHHGQDLETDVAYMLSGKIMDNDLILPSRGCWMEKWHELSGEEVRGLRGVYAENCECPIKFCFGPYCKTIQSFKPSTCGWELRNFREPMRDCAARHNMCARQHGTCQWTTGQGYDSCMRPFP
ncbi:Metalloproteinase inhibitor 3 [Desmophyllum pertusum]|uniref:Metalloproteinase inhibitor 3 n=1 Tax=Desmophyllum pertusum TaxID=174260 RepID=A0A9W9ZA74_9CNID|nr:Metalloproteinase inhibitor 3 [Desmophyllum pertusum]